MVELEAEVVELEAEVVPLTGNGGGTPVVDWPAGGVYTGVVEEVVPAGVVVD